MARTDYYDDPDAPTPNSIQATGCWLMKPCTSAFMIEACGAARIGRVSPAACSPNWKLTARITIASPTASADASTPRNFTFSSAAAQEPGKFLAVLASALAVGLALSMLHGYACVSHGGDQVVLGMAITMTAAGLTVVLGIAWFAQGGQTPPVPESVRLGGWFAGTGAQVAREYYINDAANSTQMINFGKSLVVRYLQELGQSIELPEDGY